MNTEEIVKVEKLKNYTAIHWIIGRWCNYSCRYCTLQKKDRIVPNYKEIKRIAIQINYLLNNILEKNVKLFMSGGEISYFPLDEILDVIDSKYLTGISIKTNLSAKRERYQFIKDYCKNRNITCRISASCHLEQIKDLDDFLNKAKEYADKITLVYDEKLKDDILKVVNFCKANNVHYEVQSQRINNNSLVAIPDFISSDNTDIAFKVTLKDGQIKNYVSKSDFFNDFSEPSFKNFYCNSGIDHILIKDGKIVRNTCTQLKKHPIEIMEFNPKELKPVRCDMNYCALSHNAYTISKNIGDCYV